MSSKTSQLQIRVTPAQKAELKRRARAAGQDVSSYVMLRVLPPASERMQGLIDNLASEPDPSFTLAEINDVLEGLLPPEFGAATAELDVTASTSFLQNYLVAMVELAAHQKGVAPPGWTRRVQALAMPHFLTDLRSLRPYLLRVTPVVFKRRNIFLDSSIGSRV